MPPSRTSKVFALSLGKGLNTIVALASGMVMARILSQAELATYRQTLLAYQVAIPLLALGIPQAIYYFLPTEKTRARGLVVDALIMMVTMGLLYAVFIALGGNHLLAKRFSNPAIVNTLAYLVPLPLIMLPAGLLSSVMVVQNRVNTLTVYNVLSHLILAVGIIAACLLWRTPESMILAKVGISIVTGLFAVALILRAVPKDDYRPSFDHMKTMVKFSTPLVIAGGIGTISLQLDKIIVSAMCSPEEFAVYSNGAIEIPLIGIITGSIMSVLLPDIRIAASRSDHGASIRLFRTAAIKSGIFLIPIMLFLMYEADSFIITLFSRKYTESILPFRLYLTIIPLRIVLFGAILSAYGKTKTILYRAAAGLLANAIFSVILVKAFGYIGAIGGTILSIYIVEAIWNIQSIAITTKHKRRDVLPFKQIGQLFIISVASGFPSLLIKLVGINFVPAISLSIHCVLFIATFIVIVLLCRIRWLEDELIIAVQCIRQLTRKILYINFKTFNV